MADDNTPLETDAPVDADTDRDLAVDTAVADALSAELPVPADTPVDEDPDTGRDLAADTAVAEALSHEPVEGAGVSAEADAGPSPDSDAGVPADSDTGTPVQEEPPIGMPTAELRAVVEALVFASPEPITPKTLYKLLANESKEAVSAAVNELRLEYLERPGLQMVEVAGGYQITTRPELHEWVRRLFHERSTQKLSVAALESLAVISYKQPVTALEVTEIRGVNASGVLSTLLERNLVKIVGRKNVVGRPFMYGTTKEFLIRFGLKDLGDLPRIEDMADALGFDPPAGLIERTPREEMLPLDETEEGAPSIEADAAGALEQPREGSPSELDPARDEEAPDPEAS